MATRGCSARHAARLLLAALLILAVWLGPATPLYAAPPAPLPARCTAPLAQEDPDTAAPAEEDQVPAPILAAVAFSALGLLFFQRRRPPT